jgi:hypothetical protein
MILAVLASEVALAWESSVYGQEHDGRELHGHAFVPNDALLSPFVTTRIGFSSGVGRTDVDLQTAEGPVEERLGTLKQDADVEIAITPFLGLRASAGGFVVAPLDASTAMAYGADVEYEWRLGGVVMLFRSDAWAQISASADYQYEKGKALQPAAALQATEDLIAETYDSAIDALAASGSVDEAEDALYQAIEDLELGVPEVEGAFLRDESDHVLRAGVQGAFSPGRVLGAQLDVGYARVVARRTTESRPADLIRVGGGLSVDLAASTFVPLGVSIAYVHEQPLQGAFETERIVGGGLYYTRRRDLVLGFDAAFAGEDVDLAGERRRQSHVTAALRLWYYW